MSERDGREKWKLSAFSLSQIEAKVAIALENRVCSPSARRARAGTAKDRCCLGMPSCSWLQSSHPALALKVAQAPAENSVKSVTENKPFKLTLMAS